MMRELAVIDLSADAEPKRKLVSFRGRDNYSLSDRRRCVRIEGGERLALGFTLRGEDLAAGTAEVCVAAMAEVFDSHAYTRKFLNSTIAVSVNGTVVFDDLLHWRSHEETASFWPWFNFTFDAALLRSGANTVEIINRTTRESLGAFFDAQLLSHFSEAEAVRKLATIYVSDVRVVHVAEPRRFPRLAGVPASAVAGRAVVVEVSTGDAAAAVRVVSAENAGVVALGAAHELGEERSLFEITPMEAGRPVRVAFEALGASLTANIERVYAERGGDALVALPGMETTYWHMAKPAVRDVFELGTGTGVRISIDDFLANLHLIPLEKWVPLVRYIVRRRMHLALQRLRVPPYSKIQHAEMVALADMAGPLFVGIAIPEPVLQLHHTAEADQAKRLSGYLEYFAKRMEETRLPGHKLVTFDSAGPLCGHYYRMGLDVHVAEIGPACNVLEESACRGGSAAFGKPWGVAAAMHWYFGQGAHYAYDDARVRLARLTMFSSYLAGARQILWEGGVFDNLPVYNFILSEESWRDYYRRYDDEPLVAVRRCFSELIDYDRAQQLPSPRVRFGVVRGNNDTFHGSFDAKTSKFGDMSMARAWSLLSVFMPHVSFGRHGSDHSRPTRRWYSATPYGQVDVVPAEAEATHLSRYALLALLGWNTMDEMLHAKLVAYVENGGRLFIALPHLATDTIQTLEWAFFRGGDLTELCGVRVSDLGGRIEHVDFADASFEPHLPRRFTLSPKNPLTVADFDEVYPVFSTDTTYFGGDLQVDGAEVLASSQRGEPVLLRRRIGAGEVFLLNSWSHAGHGRMRDLAEGVLRSLVEATPAPLRVDDPAGVVSWFEYPMEGCTRYCFLNTDWTREDGVAEVVVHVGGDRVTLSARPAQPVMLASDGKTHLVIDSPAVQITSWQRSDGWCDVTTAGGSVGASVRCAGAGGAAVYVDGERLA